MLNFELVLGGPGTGKTHRLVELVAGSGVDPARVAFVAFTRAAAEEARTRAAEALDLSPRRLPWFRTLHSLCFARLGLRRGDVLEGEALRELEALTGERERGLDEGDAGAWDVDALARATGANGEEIARVRGLDAFAYRRAVAARQQFKEDRGLLDFTDMLERYQDNGSPLDVDLAIVDEAQDLTPLQWAVVARAFPTARLIIGGDDDQAIHTWAGATIAPLLNGAAGSRVETLAVSHRLPRAVHGLATGILEEITPRLEKPTVPADRDGMVEFYPNAGDVPLQATSGTWLLLARARYQLRELEALARAAGVPYAVRGRSGIDRELLEAAAAYERDAPPAAPRWHDALTDFPLEAREYLLACRRGGEKLNVPPRVAIDTVHGAKGRQADHVLLLTDLPARVARGADAQPADEARVAYVGVTRARETLHVVAARGPFAWRI